MTEETKIIKVSFRIFVVFLITWSPLSVLFMVQLGGLVPPFIYLFAGLLAHCNSTLNFVFYFLQDGVFQKSLKRLVARVVRLNFYWSEEGFTRWSKTTQDGMNNNYSMLKDKSPLLLFMMNNRKESGKTSSEIVSPKENEANIGFTMTIVFRRDLDVSPHDSDVEL
uniref:G-protein coupled receptors family 1 profile domain-containing protein n=1 Tax=Romanomermis culicivorax TaxID=13658 RepID=A0A915HFJ9_ROMCU